MSGLDGETTVARMKEGLARYYSEAAGAEIEEKCEGIWDPEKLTDPKCDIKCQEIKKNVINDNTVNREANEKTQEEIDDDVNDHWELIEKNQKDSQRNEKTVTQNTIKFTKLSEETEENTQNIVNNMNDITTNVNTITTIKTDIERNTKLLDEQDEDITEINETYISVSSRIPSICDTLSPICMAYLD